MPADDRRATIAVAVQFAVNGAFFASFLPRLPELRDRVDVTTADIGVLLTIASATGVLASLTVRAVIARFGVPHVLRGGGLVIAAALAALGAARTWPVALGALAVMFACDVYVDVAMNMEGASLSGRRTRPIMNRLHGLWSLGSVAGGLVAAAASRAGISLTVHLAVAAALLAVVSTLVASQLRSTALAPATRSTATRPRVRVFFVAGLTAIVIETAAINWSPFRVRDDLAGSSSAAALAYVAVVGGMTITRFAGDHLASRWGADRFMVGSAVVAVGGLVVAGVVANTAVAVAAFAVAGLGIATLAPRLYDAAARAGAGTASGLGVLSGGMRSATIVAPLVIASLASVTSVGTAIAVVSAVAGVAFVVAARSVSRLSSPHR